MVILIKKMILRWILREVRHGVRLMLVYRPMIVSFTGILAGPNRSKQRPQLGVEGAKELLASLCLHFSSISPCYALNLALATRSDRSTEDGRSDADSPFFLSLSLSLSFCSGFVWWKVQENTHKNQPKDQTKQKLALKKMIIITNFYSVVKSRACPSRALVQTFFFFFFFLNIWGKW